MEKYLKTDYDVFEDKKYLTEESDIVGYFEDVGRDFLDCGQGYYQDELELICKIGDKFYNVLIKAEIDSAKQDRGDRLYWVECIESVKYKEIEKPLPIDRNMVIYTLNLTKEEERRINDILEDLGVDIAKTM